MVKEIIKNEKRGKKQNNLSRAFSSVLAVRCIMLHIPY
jgi:hypothetical protein